MRKSFLLPILLLAYGAQAQQVRPAASAEIYHEIAQLKNLTNVLYMAAHPDDENTRLLAWLVNDRHIHTAYLSLTRGDGGQNILGSEQGAALGLIRTHELLAARKLDGAEQFFTRAIDFGFSKTHEETFNHWDANKLTQDAVWVMRKFRPDVIVCRFPPNTNAGHGHHAASAIIAAKAFKAAGDKTMYPEQLSTYAAWQPKRILFNSYRFGSRNTTSEDQFKLAVGQYNALLGMGSSELAGISRSVHKSQGAGTPSTPGIQTEYFALVDGDSLSTSLFDGIDITWGRVGKPEIGDEIKNILKVFDFRKPERSLPALIALRKQIATVKDTYWRTQKLAELDRVILDCSGFMAELYTQQAQATAGSSLPFTLRLISRSDVPFTIKHINWVNGDSTLNTTLGKDSLFTFTHNIQIPANTPITQPYWLSAQAEGTSHYPFIADSLTGEPETPNALNATITVAIDGYEMVVPVPLSYKKLDPVKGDVVEQLRIVPDVSLDFTTALIIRDGKTPANASVRIHAYKDVPNASLAIYNDFLNEKITGLNLKEGMDTTITVTIPETMFTQNKDFNLFAKVWTADKDYSKHLNIIQYDHLPTLQYFTTPYTKVLQNNWSSTAKRIAYIEGAGDHVAEILQLAGIQVDLLKSADITAAKLKKYDAVVTGIRAVNTKKEMAEWMPELLKYTANGGTLVMQYNTLQDMATQNLGPYPFTLSSSRVTEEDAVVTFIDSTNKLLNTPNKITQADFNDWVQERGLYFPAKWDEHYQPLFRMNDQGEAPLDGSTLYTLYGKGAYVYTTLSFSRQLPAGNKGAIRLFLNFISAGGKQPVKK
jgi:LmbE family N-acetylglucosaminyl deacetylase